MPLKRKWNDYVDQILEMKKQRTEAVVPPPRPIENFWVKNLNYVITPITEAKFWVKNLNYVITPVTVAKVWSKI